jgi:hypothetical protein
MLTEVSNGDDWVALYDGDILIAQGREISYKWVLEHFKKEYEEKISAHSDASGVFPEKLSEIKDLNG